MQRHSLVLDRPEVSDQFQISQLCCSAQLQTSKCRKERKAALLSGMLHSRHLAHVLCIMLALVLATAKVGTAETVVPGPTAVLQQQAAGPAAGQALCKLVIQGFGKKIGIASASLSCTGGTITAAAHDELLQFWGTKRPTQGVVWKSHEAGACAPGSGCLLSICGGSATFLGSTASGVQTNEASVLVCVGNSARLTFRNGNFTVNNLTPLAILHPKAHVLVVHGNFQGNIMTEAEANLAGAIVVNNGTLVVQSSTFLGNKASGRQTGALTVEGQGIVTINESRFGANRAKFGGAVHATDQAHVTVHGGTFEGNTASGTAADGMGGAFYAWGDATVNILPSSSKQGETPASGPICTVGCLDSFPPTPPDNCITMHRTQMMSKAVGPAN